MKKKTPPPPKLEYRYYEMPENELVLPLLGEDWIRPYGENIDYLHFHNFLEVGICHSGEGEVILNGVLTIASLISIFPLVWMVIAATNRSVDVVAGRVCL